MENTQLQPKQKLSEMSLKQLMATDSVQNKFKELLKDKATQFTTSLLQVVSGNNKLAQAVPMTVYNAALMAAALDLPINQNLGFAYIVPFNRSYQDERGTWQKSNEATFQCGTKGYIQLAMRTGQYLRLNVTEVYENQFKSFNALTEELDCDFSVDGNGKIVGYAAYFKMLNGMEKTVYWSDAKTQAHGQKFSKSYKTGPWRDNNLEMCKKTVLKNLLTKWGILSVEMQNTQLNKALQADQAIIGTVTVTKEDGTEVEEITFEYADNATNVEAKVELSAEEKAAQEYDNNILMLIATATDVEQLDAIKEDNMPEKFNEEWQAAYAELLMPTKSKK
jgi:recombination protein RecT